MTKFHPAKMRGCDPYILVLLIRVRRSHSRLGSEGELSHTVCVHLWRVPSEKVKLLLLILLVVGLMMAEGIRERLSWLICAVGLGV